MAAKTPLKAIRAMCMSCAGTAVNVKLCDSKVCPLQPYRLGKDPNRKPRHLTEEQKAATAARLRAAREKRTIK